MSFQEKVQNIYPEATLFEDATFYDDEKTQKVKFRIILARAIPIPNIIRDDVFNIKNHGITLGWWSTTPEKAWSSVWDIIQLEMLEKLEQ